jgi:hypothetical protein
MLNTRINKRQKNQATLLLMSTGLTINQAYNSHPFYVTLLTEWSSTMKLNKANRFRLLQCSITITIQNKRTLLNCNQNDELLKQDQIFWIGGEHSYHEWWSLVTRHSIISYALPLHQTVINVRNIHPHIIPLTISAEWKSFYYHSTRYNVSLVE